MDSAIVTRDGLALLYYEQREHFDHDEAVRRVASFTGQPAEVIESVVNEEMASA